MGDLRLSPKSAPARPHCWTWGGDGTNCKGALVAEEEQRGVPKPQLIPSPKVAGVKKWSHRDTLVTWLALQQDLVLPPGLLWGPCGLSRGSPGAAPGVSMPPAPQAGSSLQPLRSVEQDEHQFGTSLCPPARSPSCYE